MDAGSLKGPGGEGQQQELSFLWEQHRALGWEMAQTSVGAEVVTVCHKLMLRRKMKPSSENWNEPHVHRPTSS